MKYCLADILKAEAHGIKSAYHKKNAAGDKIVVNELELMRLDDSISKAAIKLGGELLSLAQVREQMGGIETSDPAHSKETPKN